MSTKPGVFKLSSESYQFVRANVGVLISHLKIIFPLAVLMEIINQVGLALDAKYITTLTLFPSILLYGCFALSWHRTSLTHPSADHAINPFRIRGPEAGFMWVFLGIALLPVVAITVVIFVGMYAGHVLGKESAAFLIVPIFISAIFFVIFMIRLSFLLPARSVGFKLKLADAKRASKGLVWPLLGASFIFSLLLMVFAALYMFVVSLTMNIAVGSERPDTVATHILDLIVAIPMYAATYVLMALNITALSRAYQWGIQNNAYKQD